MTDAPLLEQCLAHLKSDAHDFAPTVEDAAKVLAEFVSSREFAAAQEMLRAVRASVTEYPNGGVQSAIEKETIQMSVHWTSRNIKDFVHRIVFDFTSQIEEKMEELSITRSAFADKIGVSNGRVSQVLGNPGNMTIGKMVEYAKGVGMKVAIVAYEDGDPDNNNGPINSQIFSMCWKKVGKPTDFWPL